MQADSRSAAHWPRSTPSPIGRCNLCRLLQSLQHGERTAVYVRSGRRAVKGYIGRVPHFNAVFKVLESEATTPVLQALIAATASPLRALESNFAVDSSGFSSSRFDRWYDHKFGDIKIQRAWVKAHIMCGVKTNVITAVEIHDKDAGDSPQLPPLLNSTTQRFNVAEVSADMGYSAESNLQAILDVGASPYIPFKRNASGKTRGGLWAKMFHYFNYNRDEFMARYHQRSNIESTFSMVKAKFGDCVRSKTDTAMKNEVLAKFVCHNLCCVVQSMYEFNVDPNFSAGSLSAPPKLKPELRIKMQSPVLAALHKYLDLHNNLMSCTNTQQSTQKPC